MALETLIRDLLAPLVPISLMIQDDSAAHIGHKGAENGAGHYTVRIVSAQFNGISTIARHKMVYQLLSELIPARIHALSIHAQEVQGTASL